VLIDISQVLGDAIFRTKVPVSELISFFVTGKGLMEHIEELLLNSKIMISNS
jgi:hypothetical protein